MTLTRYAVGPDGKLVNGVQAAKPPSSTGEPVVVRNFLTAGEIAAAFREIGALQFEPAMVGNREFNPKARESLVAWLPSNSFLAHRMAGAAKAAADEPLTQWGKPQVACYGVGGFYGWHLDAGGSTAYRRWSAVLEVQSAPGGALEFEGYDAPDLQAGDLCVFPSSVRHRATPPREGTRFSVTMWFWHRPEPVEGPRAASPSPDAPQPSTGREGAPAQGPVRRTTNREARERPTAEDSQEAWPMGPTVGAVRRMQERETQREERNASHDQRARSAPWFNAISAAVDRRSRSPDVELQYPRGVRPLHQVLRWPKVLSLAASVLLKESTPAILVWDTALVSGTHRWVANEILEEAGFSERIPVMDVRDAGLEPLVAFMFDRGFGSATIQDAVYYALGWGEVDAVFWDMAMPVLRAGAEAHETGRAA